MSGPMQGAVIGGILYEGLAADAAEDAPRALMMAAPRCWTVVMNSPLSQS